MGEGGENCLRFLVYWGGVRWVVQWEVVVDETVIGISWQELGKRRVSTVLATAKKSFFWERKREFGGKPRRLQIACSLCSRTIIRTGGRIDRGKITHITVISQLPKTMRPFGLGMACIYIITYDFWSFHIFGSNRPIVLAFDEGYSESQTGGQAECLPVR